MNELNQRNSAPQDSQNTQGEPTPQAPTPASANKPVNAQPSKKSVPKKAFTKLVIYIVAILIILFITNPSTIPFLPKEFTSSLERSTQSLLGDMSEIVDMLTFNFGGIVQVIVMVLVLLVLKEVLQFLFKLIKPKTPRGQTLHDLSLSSLNYIMAICGIFWGLSLLGVNVSTLFASAGVLALIIGFGAESLIADIITGAFIIIENQYNVDDIIEVDGYRGTVTHIGLRTTSITDISGNEKIFNNSDIRNIINLSNDNSFAVCDVTIPYEADLEKARTTINILLQNLYNKNPEMFRAVPEFLGVQELGSDGVVLRICAGVNEKDRFDAARMINWELKVELQKAGMGVPHSNELIVS